MTYKSLHTIFYSLSYDNFYNPPESINNNDFGQDIVYFMQFNTLFCKKKISCFEIGELLDGNQLKASNESILTLELEDSTYELQVEKVKIYCVKTHSTIIIALNLVNNKYTNFSDLSMHLDKNTSYSLHDKFNGIRINQSYVAKNHNYNINSAQLLNEYFFGGALLNPKLVLGRKNYHMFSVVDQHLSDLCKDISKDKNFEIYKLATSEPVNATVGRKTYDEFLETIYDKWEDTGSLYIVNFTNFLQILPIDGLDHSISFMRNYEKMVVLTLIQKTMFVKFQIIEQNRNDIRSFKKFINHYYYLEISPERQMDSIYRLLQKGLKNMEYYEILTSEIEIYSAAINNRIMFFITVTYTFFAILSVIIMLWEIK